VRWKILECLRGSEERLCVTEIAEKIGEDRRNVADHLTVLESYGFVESEYGVIEKTGPHLGRLGKFYRPTRKVEEIFEKMREELSRRELP
jgi:predicted transcriptional regulator